MGGVAFHSHRRFAVEQTISVAIRQILVIQAIVVGCDEVEPAADGSPRFKIRCRFAEEDYGLRFLVLVMEMEGGRR